MTPTKSASFCPLCPNVYMALPHHLTRFHGVENIEERRLLLNLASGRVNVRYEACPVSGCKYKSSRLDKHIRNGHTKLNMATVQVNLQAARRQVTFRLLAALRASNPAVPVVTGLDMDMDMELQEEGEVEKRMKKICSNPKCARLFRRLSIQVKHLESELSRSRKTFQRLSKMLRRFSSAPKTPKPGKAGSGSGGEEMEEGYNSGESEPNGQPPPEEEPPQEEPPEEEPPEEKTQEEEPPEEEPPEEKPPEEKTQEEEPPEEKTQEEKTQEEEPPEEKTQEEEPPEEEPPEEEPPQEKPPQEEPPEEEPPHPESAPLEDSEFEDEARPVRTGVQTRQMTRRLF
ncbi:uncharacterized protein LOC142952746 [Anarhichas minor]|uniref:uncharacterized protein LOC142952746 n=1 Tax=Anarhichas minor TaxID=65739 RepID=UPI003F734B6C